ncbi:GT99 family glycosyltransferase N-terminal domain-containing protein [Lysobacter brunescens]|uniref:Glycosyltransferase 99 N-terminal domain-containing protein n=1 Tax=Lysobacter brunescens TaxID=262323 RepID=A0ABW2YFS7_9GAMM
MYLSFLMPYVDRGSGPLFRWVMLAQMAAFEPHEIAFIADERYFAEEGIPFGENLSVSGYSFVCPSLSRFRSYARHSLPEDARSQVHNESHIETFHRLLTTEDIALSSAIREGSQALLKGGKGKAFLTWCNCPSLGLAARDLGLPVIHNEFGPLRAPLFSNTIYFDFRGVNGNTTPANWREEAEIRSLMQGAELIGPDAVRELLFHGEFSPRRSADRRIGVALQVEDDSNVIAYSNGVDSLRLLHKARMAALGSPLLVRNHPGAHFEYKGFLGARDTSPDSVAFLEKVCEVHSINSSVLCEAFLLDLPYRSYGDSAISAFSPGGRLHSLACSDRTLALNAFFIGYLVPSELLFNKDYYEWRLSKDRTLAECHEYHLTILRGQKHELERIQSARHDPTIRAPDEEESRCDGEWLSNRRLDLQMQAMSNELAWRRKSVASLEGQISDLSTRIRTLEDELSIRTDAVSWLEAALERSNRCLDQRDATIVELRTHIDERNDAATWLESQLEAHRSELDANRESLSELRAYLADRLEAIEWIDSQRRSLAEACSLAERQHMELRSEIERMTETIKDSDSKCAELAAEKEDLQSELLRLSKNISDFRLQRIVRLSESLRLAKWMDTHENE